MKYTVMVGRWSAGCQVMQKEDDFKEVIHLTTLAEMYWGNSFSYTLLEEKDFETIK